MVVDEARRTFTYLNLYGYLTDAVIVNRVFGPETGTYFGAWRDRQQEQIRVVESGFSPVPVLQAPYFDEEVVGTEMLDRLAASVFHDTAPDELLHDAIAEDLSMNEDGSATLRLSLPLAERGELTLKRIGAELVVGVADHRRTMLLPPALEGLQPAGARLTDGVLEVSFQTADDRVPAGAGAS
jgi:arsenite-transporting ATPase